MKKYIEIALCITMLLVQYVCAGGDEKYIEVDPNGNKKIVLKICDNITENCIKDISLDMPYKEISEKNKLLGAEITGHMSGGNVCFFGGVSNGGVCVGAFFWNTVKENETHDNEIISKFRAWSSSLIIHHHYFSFLLQDDNDKVRQIVNRMISGISVKNRHIKDICLYKRSSSLIINPAVDKGVIALCVKKDDEHVISMKIAHEYELLASITPYEGEDLFRYINALSYRFMPFPEIVHRKRKRTED